jgi:hypothetical protein
LENEKKLFRIFTFSEFLNIKKLIQEKKYSVCHAVVILLFCQRPQPPISKLEAEIFAAGAF